MTVNVIGLSTVLTIKGTGEGFTSHFHRVIGDFRPVVKNDNESNDLRSRSNPPLYLPQSNNLPAHLRIFPLGRMDNSNMNGGLNGEGA